MSLPTYTSMMLFSSLHARLEWISHAQEEGRVILRHNPMLLVEFGWRAKVTQVTYDTFVQCSQCCDVALLLYLTSLLFSLTTIPSVPSCLLLLFPITTVITTYRILTLTWDTRRRIAEALEGGDFSHTLSLYIGIEHWYSQYHIHIMMMHSTTLLTLALSTLSSLPSPSHAHSAAVSVLSGSDHLVDNAAPSVIEIPLHRRQRRPSSSSSSDQKKKRSPSWLADHLVNLKSVLDVNVDASSSSSLASGDNNAAPLLQSRIADFSTFNWIKNRVSSKWSQRGDEPPSPSSAASSSSSSSSSGDENEAFKRANKRPLIPVNVDVDSNGFKKVIKRQDEAPAAATTTAAGTPAADSQPTLARSRAGASNPKMNPKIIPQAVKVPLEDDVVAREDIEVRYFHHFFLGFFICLGAFVSEKTMSRSSRDKPAGCRA